MDLKNLFNKMNQFNRRWSIKSNETPEKEIFNFKVRIINVFEGVFHDLTDESIYRFCQYFSIRNNRSEIERIIDDIYKGKDERKFYQFIEFMLSLDFNTLHDRYEYIRKVTEAIEISNVNVAIKNTNQGVILYPKGEKVLDDEIVNYPLSFLDEKSGKHFIQALRDYEDKKPVKSAESLRRSLEEFLKIKLDNTKGLKGNIDELQGTLKQGSNDPQIRNIIFQTFNYLDIYFNDNSKHNDGDISESENEFLIYQTGLLMRYIDKNITIT